MEKYELEFPFKTSSNLLYKRISTASGLGEWFADDVRVKGDKFTFVWDGHEQIATLTEKKKNERVRFCWEDAEDEDTFFEFAIRKNSLTGDNALIITDFAEDEDDKEDAVQLWDNQVSKLKTILGS